MSQTVREIDVIAREVADFDRSWMWGFNELLRKAQALARHVLASEEPLGDEKKSAANIEGDNLCWFDSLPANAKIPPREEFLESCSRFHQQISQTNGVLSGCKTIAQLESNNADLRAQLQTAQQRITDECENVLAAVTAAKDAEIMLESVQQLADERGRDVERLRTALLPFAELATVGWNDLVQDDVRYQQMVTNRMILNGRACFATPAATPPAQEHPDTACSFMFLNPLDQSPMIAKTLEETRKIALEYLGREDWSGDPTTILGIYRIQKVGEVTETRGSNQD